MAIPLFTARVDWPAICLQSELPTVQHAIDLILGEFQNAISDAFHTFYQRRADMRSVTVAHTATANALEEVQKRVISACESAEKFYTSIPVLKDVKEKSLALAEMLFLDEIKEIFCKQSAAVIALLRCPKKQADLAYFKEKIAAIDALSDWGNVFDYFTSKLTLDQKHQQLQTLYNEIASKQDNYLYTPLLRYMLYVAEQLKAPEAFINELKTKLGITTLLYPAAEVDATLPQSAAMLSPHEQFRTGQTLTTINYRDIKDVTDELQQIAAFLKERKRDTFQKMRAACQSGCLEIDRRHSPLHAINLCFNRLLAKSFSTQVHAGWYYEDAVRTCATELDTLQTAIEQSPFSQKCRSVKAVAEYLTTNETDKKIALLYQAIQLATVNPVIEQTIARDGEIFLQPTREEQELLPSVFSRTVPFNHLLIYLLKGLIRNIYFQKDPEFEVLFSMLKHDPFYKRGFAIAIQENSLLSTLAGIYSLTTPVEITPLVSALYEPEPQNAPPDALLLNTLELEHRAILLSGQQTRLTWLKQKISDKKSFLCPQTDFATCTHVDLRDQICKSLFGSDESERESANSALIELINQPNFTLDSLTGIVRSLLLRWRFERYMQTGDLDMDAKPLQALTRDFKNLLSKEKTISPGKKLLAVLFSDYQAGTTARLWHSQYGFGYMELALRKYVEDSQTECTRSPIWKEFMNYYHDFRTSFEVRNEFVTNTNSFKRATQLYEEAQAIWLTNPSDTITEALLDEMKQLVKGERFTYVK